MTQKAPRSFEAGLSRVGVALLFYELGQLAAVCVLNHNIYAPQHLPAGGAEAVVGQSEISGA
ncbi:hypothetical protein SAMN05519104_8193 [Rhizobiales bacterium GAS188]|nr:hypothetical protein SAMN05519104_8193 [Rhizobiales bacterium GAS188]